MAQLDGTRIAILTAQTGVENAELVSPARALRDHGAVVVLIAPEKADVQTVVHDTDKAEAFSADLALRHADSADYDALVLPGGTVNADRVRSDPDAVDFVKGFVDAGKPIAAICHAPWSLVEAGVLHGKRLTSYASLRTDVRNAGGEWVDQEVVVCEANDWLLITSRSPDDLPAFNAQIVRSFAAL